MPKAIKKSNGNRISSLIEEGGGEIKQIVIPRIKRHVVRFEIVGMGESLISNPFSERSRKQMFDTQTGKAKGPKEDRDPWVNFCDSLNWITERPKKPTQEDIDNSKFGFPQMGIKAAGVRACGFIDGVTMTTAGGTFFTPPGMALIKSGPPTMREDCVRNSGIGRKADLRYRAEFKEWSIDVEIDYNANLLNAEQIMNIYYNAGYSVGIGDWRPQLKNGGPHGRFKVNMDTFRDEVITDYD